MKKDETVMSLTEMVKDHRENKAKDGNQNEFDILSQRASEFSRDHSLMKGGTPTPGDEVHGHIELFAKKPHRYLSITLLQRIALRYQQIAFLFLRLIVLFR